MIEMKMMWYGDHCGRKKEVTSLSTTVGTGAPCQCCDDPECTAVATWVDSIMGTKSTKQVLCAARRGWTIRHMIVIGKIERAMRLGLDVANGIEPRMGFLRGFFRSPFFKGEREHEGIEGWNKWREELKVLGADEYKRQTIRLDKILKMKNPYTEYD